MRFILLQLHLVLTLKSLAKIGIRELDNFDFVFGKDITPEERQKLAADNYQSVLTQSLHTYW